MFAVILNGAKQYFVKEGDRLRLELLKTKEGEIHIFKKVLLYSKDEKSIDIGSPFLEKTVKSKVLKHGKEDKIRIFKMKAKKNYRRTYGHRQPYTEVEITSIS